jgi:sugar lactone lactonase YvrE
MTKQHYTAELFYTPASEELRHLPEGPRVLNNSGIGTSPMLLGWVAIVHKPGGPEGSFNILDCETLENRTFVLPGRPGFFAETKTPGVVVLGVDRRLVLLNHQTGEVTETGLEIPFDDERVIINDGMAVPGGLLFGTKHLEFNLPIAALYFYDSSAREIREVVPGQYCSNGKYYFAGEDGAIHLIDTDSIPRTLKHYIFSGPDLRFRASERLLIDPEALPSIPDGLRHDASGQSLVIAFFNTELVADGLAQQRSIKDGGALEAEWRIPGSPRVTCPEFLPWRDGSVKVLFTSATEGMTPEHRQLAPNAGCFFLADTPFDRLPAPPPLVDI